MAHYPKKNKAAPPRCQRMWLAMRFMRRFNLPQVAATAEVSLSSARTYLSELRQIGYVQTVRRHGGDSPWADYCLKCDTGPDAPFKDADGLMFDPNLEASKVPVGMLSRINAKTFQAELAEVDHERVA